MSGSSPLPCALIVVPNGGRRFGAIKIDKEETLESGLTLKHAQTVVGDVGNVVDRMRRREATFELAQMADKVATTTEMGGTLC